MMNVPRLSACWLLLVGVLLSCSGSPPLPPAPKTSPPPPGRAGDPLQLRTSFGSVGSPIVLAAALDYPVETAAPPEPPLSLTDSDGTGLELVSLDARAVVEGPLAFTELRLSFHNPRDRVIEGRFTITLPPGAAVSRLAMRIDERWMEAEVVERQRARQIYEDFLHRKQDPALLEKQAGNSFSARIFPIPAQGNKDLIVSYSHVLEQAGSSYRLPLRGLPEVRELRAEVRVGAPAAGGRLSYQSTRLERRQQAPTDDLVVQVPKAVTGLQNGELVLGRVQPALSATVPKLASVAVLFDTSASRAPGFAGQVQQLGRFLAELRRLHGAELRLSLATFDQVVDPIFTGQIGIFTDDYLRAVLARRPLGASDLHAALSWLRQAGPQGRAVLFSDGIATAGPSEDSELRAVVQSLRAAVERLDVVLLGGIRNPEGMARLARGALGTDGVVLDGEQPAAELARRVSQTTLSGVTVSIPGAVWVWPERLDGLQPGDDAIVYARLEKGALATGAKLPVSLGGPLQQQIEVALAPASRPLIERAAVRATIARLGDQLAGLKPAEAGQGAQIRQRIIELSTTHRVLSELTALLVLETEEDYDRYGLDRKSLADIMTIGPQGVELLQRDQPVLLLASSPPVEDTPSLPLSEELKERYLANLDTMDSAAQPAPSASATGAAAAPPPPPPPRPQPRVAATAPPPPVAKSPEPPRYSYAAKAAAPMQPPSRPSYPAKMAPPSRFDEEDDDDDDEAEAAFAAVPPDVRVRPGPVRRLRREAPPDSGEAAEKRAPPYAGRLAEVMKLVDGGQAARAVVEALKWRNEEPGDVLALIGLGEALEKIGNQALAARAYGSVIDLFPARADLRRYAANRLDRLGRVGLALAADSYAKAVEQRPDHLTGHRLLAYALLRQQQVARAFEVIEKALSEGYPGGRFAGGTQVLQEDLGLIAAVWLQAKPALKSQLQARLSARGAKLATAPSLRFVLTWETDANDVDLHIYDGAGRHAYYEAKTLASGGELYADVTTGYGPECFTIEGPAQGYPYRIEAHYYSRGPMGYGMGKVEIIRHDGRGSLSFAERPFVVMNDQAYVPLGTLSESERWDGELITVGPPSK